MAVLELTAAEMDSLDEEKLTDAMVSVDVLMRELLTCPKDMWDAVTAQYAELYLNPYYILAVRARIPKVRRIRLSIYGLVVTALAVQVLLLSANSIIFSQFIKLTTPRREVLVILGGPREF